jgi:hypothetical protein
MRMPMRNCMTRSAGRWFRHQRLHRDRRLDGSDDAWKLRQETVAGVLHKPAAVVEDDRIDRASVGALNAACVPASSAPIIRE